MEAVGMFEEGESKYMLVPNPTIVKFELIQLEPDIFEKRSLITADSSSEYSDYSKASSSQNPSDTGSYPGSKTKRLADPNNLKVLRKRRLASEKPTKSNTSQQNLKDVDRNEDRCDYCSKKGFLICCDICPAAFHQQCHTPPIETIPRGQFECYRCYYKKYYEKNPIRSPPSNSNLTQLQKYEIACFTKRLKTMRIVPFTLSDHVKSLVNELPSIMPYQEFKRKLKRKKTDHLNNCYICDRSVTLYNSNQCHFCSNTLHLECDPVPSCSTRFYAWRCPLHIENYLDTYLLESTSTHRRLKLWSQHTNQKLDEESVEKEFVNRLEKQSELDEKMEAAKTLISLGNTGISKERYSDNLLDYTEAERQMLIFDKSMFCTEIFAQNSKAVAVFVPAFKTPIFPLIYDGSLLSIGTSPKCTFNLKSLPFDCKNMVETQLILRKKQGVDYLCCGTTFSGYTRVNGILLTERPSNSLNYCKCVNLDKIIYKNQQFYSKIAVFPNRIYIIQLGCAFFYLVFNPVLHSHKPRQY